VPCSPSHRATGRFNVLEISFLGLEGFMKRHLGWALASVISVAGFGAASAADMAVKARPMVVPVYNWTGCYVGLSAGSKGVATKDTVYNQATAFPTPASSVYLGRLEDETWIAGGQVGCNYQSGKWVFGIEGDAHGQRWGMSSTLIGPTPFNFLPGDTFELRSDWQASVRGRVGYAMDRTLFYVSGGAAFTQVRAFSNWIPAFIGPIPVPGVLAFDSKTLTGGTVGAGVEYAATDNFTLGLEGRYSYYGNQKFNSGVVPVAVAPGVAVVIVNTATYRDVRVETGELIFKANWKFGPSAVVAKY
jgi:outer membrane immunogenic protein